MPYPINVETILEDIKVKCSFPNSSALLSDEEIVRLASSQQETELIPLINSLRKEYFVVSHDTPIEPGELEYALPKRSLGNKLRDIALLDHSGNEITLPELAPEQTKVPGGPFGYVRPILGVYGYFWQYDKVRLFFGTTTNDAMLNNFSAIRFKFYRKPNHLSLEGTTVTSVSGNQITVTAVPTTWEEGTKIDIIASDPIFRSRYDDLEITNISVNTITFDSDVSNAVKDDLVCRAGYTTTPQLPVETFDILVELACLEVFGILGDVPGQQTSQSKLMSLKKAFIDEFTPRTEGTSIKIQSNNTIFDSGAW